MEGVGGVEAFAFFVVFLHCSWEEVDLRQRRALLVENAKWFWR